MSEQRVISSAKRPVGGIREGRGREAPAAAEPDGAKKKRKKPKKLVLIVAAVAVLAIAGAAYVFVLKPSPAAGAEPAEPEPVPGEILTIEAVSVNLADGHYLRLGMGLQLVEGGGAHGGATAPDPALALDLAIALYSGHTVAEVSDPATREALKAELVTELEHAYHGGVMDVYLTDYVTQ